MEQQQELLIPMPWGVFGVKTWNSSSLKPMLVLHGSDDNAASFDPLIPLLLSDYYYVCVDLPGHGFSTAFTSGLPLSFENFVSALQRLIHHFGWQHISVMGHSFGAQLALVLAAAEMGKIQEVILLDGIASAPVSNENVLMVSTNELIELLKREKNHFSRVQLSSLQEAIEKKLKRMNPLPEEVTRAVLERTLVKSNQGYFSRADFRTCFNTRPHVSEEVWCYMCKMIKCPVLLMFAEQSKVIEFYNFSEFHQKLIKILLSSNPLSRMEHVSGDHTVHCHNPQLVSQVINRFLTSTKVCPTTVMSNL